MDAYVTLKETPSYVSYFPGLGLGSITDVPTEYLRKMINSYIYTCMISHVLLTETGMNLNPYVIKK